MVVSLAVPPVEREYKSVQQIAAELEKLARLLRSFPQATGGNRGAGPANAIVASLEKVNATLEEASRRGSLGSAGFTIMGREFGKIGDTLLALGSASKKSATTKTTKKNTTRKTKRR